MGLRLLKVFPFIIHYGGEISALVLYFSAISEAIVTVYKELLPVVLVQVLSDSTRWFTSYNINLRQRRIMVAIVLRILAWRSCGDTFDGLFALVCRIKTR